MSALLSDLETLISHGKYVLEKDCDDFSILNVYILDRSDSKTLI